MAKTVVLNVKGDANTYLVDLDAMTVEIVADAAAPKADETEIEGVERAVACDVRSQAAGHLLFLSH